MSTPLLVGLGIAAVVVIAVIAIYNGLVAKYQNTKNAWAQIDVQLKRRYDLIPNLVEVVKGYAKHEKETLEAVINARNRAASAGTVQEAAAAQGQLSGALRQLFALSESYPDLKANTNFQALQEELTATENRIGFARQHYNDAATNYNSSIMSFPANVLAGMFGFKAADLFQIDPAEQAAVKQAPKIQF
jgi:LemA protein